MVKKILYGIAVILFMALLYNAFELYSFTQERNKIVQEKGLTTMNTLKEQVDTILSSIVNEGKRLADDFGANEYTKEDATNYCQTG